MNLALQPLVSGRAGRWVQRGVWALLGAVAAKLRGRRGPADTWGSVGGIGSREVVAGGVGLSFLLFSALLHLQHLLKTQPSLREGLWGCAAGVWVCEGV